MKRTLSRLAGLVALAWLFTLPISLKAQTVAPLGGVGSLQVFGNDGLPLVNGAAYFYAAGTTTPIAVYTDASGTTQQPNPVTFGSGARASIWLPVGSFVKIVLCASNSDGPACNAGNILFVADQVPIGSSGGGGGGGSPFTGVFVSGTASPATSGVLRLASADSICWRNAAGSTNICWSKDSNDLLSWAGGSLKFPEVGAPSGVAGFDILWADNTAHRWKMANNSGTASQVVASGVDINTSDQVTQLHFGATATPLSGTAPTTNQCLQWNGTNIVGVSCVEVTISNAAGFQTYSATTNELSINTAIFFLPASHTLTRLLVHVGVAGVTCSTAAIVAVRDVTGASNIQTLTLAVNPVIGLVDSGALSVSMTAAHEFALIVSTAATGCATFPTGKIMAVYQ